MPTPISFTLIRMAWEPEENTMTEKLAIRIFVLTLVAVSLAFCQVMAAVNETLEITSDASGRLMLEKRQQEGMLAREDRLFIEKGEQTTVIFESEGRAIEQVLAADLDKNGSNEILVVMELGGSADLRELSLLQLDNGKYREVWIETGFSAGKVAIEAAADGSNRIVIDYFTDDEPAKEARAIYIFDGKKVALQQITQPETGG